MGSIKEVALRRTRLLLGCNRVTAKNYYVTSHLGQLSLLSLRGRLVEYHLSGGSYSAFTCVGWQVTLCDPIWQVTPRSFQTTVLTSPTTGSLPIAFAGILLYLLFILSSGRGFLVLFFHSSIFCLVSYYLLSIFLSKHFVFSSSRILGLL